MKKLVEVYFTFFLKPSLLISCFISNLNFILNESFTRTDLLVVALVFLMIKPIFFLFLYVLFILKIELQTVFQHGIALVIVILIYFGFPVKEFSDLLKYEELNKFFEGKDYFIDEYMYNHFVCNVILENFPVLFTVIGCNIAEGKWEGNHYFPIFIHSLFLLLYGIVLQHVFNRKR